MCKTCKGQGGLVIQHSYYIEFIECPDNQCDFIRDDSDIERLQAWLDSLEVGEHENSQQIV
ncbi:MULTISPECIES: hypothetical protein [unclassified Virgibacillus]|uniref:hypothetical protein n=1 Tax=unclassified Virgibacillus TaxID=2620237 RepID=UPI00090AA02C|nr:MULTISPECIES: hypothetical protein [unclassified Virgibacillus]API92687.1 hypothetical protein BKP57_13255 [Virgibacillus sp. 6R]MBS7428181.1 hypothetical protein [Virgibacillus sp. 19R1-5]